MASPIACAPPAADRPALTGSLFIVPGCAFSGIAGPCWLDSGPEPSRLIDDGIDGSEVTTQLAVITMIMAAAYLPIGAFRRQLGDPRVLIFETAGVLLFGTLALGRCWRTGVSPSTSWLPPGLDTAFGTSSTTGPKG